MNAQRETEKDHIVTRVQTGRGSTNSGTPAVHLDLYDETGTRHRFVLTRQQAHTIAAALDDSADRQE